MLSCDFFSFRGPFLSFRNHLGTTSLNTCRYLLVGYLLIDRYFKWWNFNLIDTATITAFVTSNIYDRHDLLFLECYPLL